MKPKATKRRQQGALGKRYYTYSVLCSFNLQYTFTESQVESDLGSGAADLIPTDKALRNLAKELTKLLGSNYAISDLDVNAESDDLMGVAED